MGAGWPLSFVSQAVETVLIHVKTSKVSVESHVTRLSSPCARSYWWACFLPGRTERSSLFPRSAAFSPMDKSYHATTCCCPRFSCYFDVGGRLKVCPPRSKLYCAYPIFSSFSCDELRPQTRHQVRFESPLPPDLSPQAADTFLAA